MSPKKILFNPFDKEFQQDPYPTYDRLRQEDPVHKSIFDTWIGFGLRLRRIGGRPDRHSLEL